MRRLGWLPVLVMGCSDALVEKTAKDEVNVDDRLTLSGRVCTDRPDPSGFPVKVLFVVDQSGSMCISDPPGSQSSSTFCQSAQATVNRTGQTTPGRVRALNRLLDSFAGKPNVKVALVPFETTVRPATPAQGFARPDNQELRESVKNLQSQLGKGTDYQGALAYAYGRVRSDIETVSRTNPAELPRTRYLVVFLSDGVPYPRCSANDELTQYADDQNPDLTWADSFAVAGPDGFCNLTDPEERRRRFGTGDSSDNISTYAVGTDRNQNYQLRAYVDQLMELKDQYNVGDVRLHTVLLFNEQAVRACGEQCQDVYGEYVRWPGPVKVDGPPSAHRIARWTLDMLATRGNGIFQEFRDFEGVARLDLGSLDYASLRSKLVMKTLFVQPLSSTPGPVDRLVDSDGDGLPDDDDNDFTWNTSRFDPDSDGDGFPDAFEVARRGDGFRPDARDGRGCDPANPATRRCTPTDVDGDGLSDYLERYLDRRLADTNLIDADGDGLPNGLEVQWGLDPVTPQRNLDTDGDGVPDSDELRLSTNPLRRDRELREKNGLVYELKAVPQADDSTCYDFSVSNLQLVTPPLRAGQSRQGFNLFKVWFAESPESSTATDYGTWKTACAWAQYDPPSVRVPSGPGLEPFTNADFHAPGRLNSEADYDARCLGVSPSRGQPAR